jgi:PAS domain S-box-containing protein
MPSFGRRKEDWTTAYSPLLLGIVSPDLVLRNINSTWERVLGYPRVKLLDKPLAGIVAPDEHAAARNLVNARPAAAGGGELEFSLRRQDGSYLRIAWERRPARGNEGVFVTGREIPGRTQAVAGLTRFQQEEMKAGQGI